MKVCPKCGYSVRPDSTPHGPYGKRGSIKQQNIERRIIGTIIHWSREGKNFAEISRELTARRIHIPHTKFVYRKGCPPRTPFYWTVMITRKLFRQWENTGSIIPFIGPNL